MSTESKRVMICIPPELEIEVRRLKDGLFGGIAQNEAYLRLIRIGLESAREKGADDTR